MSKPRFKIVAEIDTVAHATTIKNSIIAELAGMDIFETHSLISGNSAEFNKVFLIGEWRFNTQVDRDTLRDWAEDQIQNHPQVKVWTLAARLSWHNCTHDNQTIQNCNATNYSEWIK